MVEPEKYDGEKRINKILIEVSSLEEAQTMAEWFKTKTSMKYVNVCTRRPTYNKNGYVIQNKSLLEVLPIEVMRSELEEEKESAAGYEP